MTKKQPGGQYTRRYTYRATASVSRPLVRRRPPGLHSPTAGGREERKTGHGPQGRRVTMPHEAIAPLTWAQRRERFRQQGATPARTRLVQRTLAQTGRAAPVGQMRRSRPLARQRTAPVVPVRRRQTQRGPRFWQKLLGFFTLLALCGGMLGFALLSPTFHVQQLSIEGTANQSLIASIRRMGIQGQSIFLLNQAELLAHLQALPLIARVDLGIQLPSSVVVAVRERVPVLLWQSGHTIFAVARDGVVIAPASQLNETGQLALVNDRRQHSGMHPGAHVGTDDILFVEQVFARLPLIVGSIPFTLLYVDTLMEGKQSVPANLQGSGSYVVVSASGWQAYLGDAANRNSLADRLQELQQILSRARQRHLHVLTIDLRFGTRPVYTVRSS